MLCGVRRGLVVVLIFWLASYPKSGNTWVRNFLANYFYAKDEPIDLNMMGQVGMTLQDTARWIWEDACGCVPHFDLQLENRERVLRRLCERRPGTNIVKTHSINARINGHDVIPKHLTSGCVYIVRNPLDVIPSYARHFSLPVETAIERFSNPDVDLEHNGVIQPLGEWSDHVKSWAEKEALYVRYEDLPGDFGKIADYMGLEQDKRFKNAVQFSELKVLKELEKKKGFKEAVSGKFFGATKSKLTEEQKEKVANDHSEVMKYFNYI